MTPGAAVRAAIEQLNAQYAWSLDLKRYEELREVFTPDVRYVSGDNERIGIDAVIDSFAKRTGARTTRHGWSSLVLTEVNSRTVSGRSCWFSYAHNSAPPIVGTPVYMVADFLDTYVLDDTDRWRIAERRIVPVFRDPALAPS